jgi:hypothetical protein
MFNLLNMPFHFLNNIILYFLHILTTIYNQSCSSVALLLENGWNFWCVLTVKSEVLVCVDSEKWSSGVLTVKSEVLVCVDVKSEVLVCVDSEEWSSCVCWQWRVKFWCVLTVKSEVLVCVDSEEWSSCVCWQWRVKFWCVLTVKNEVSELLINSVLSNRICKVPLSVHCKFIRFVFHVGVGSRAHEKNVIVLWQAFSTFYVWKEGACICSSSTLSNFELNSFYKKL